MRRAALVLALALAVVAGCSTDANDDDRLSVVATTTILGDIVGQLTGTAADVEVLMPIGTSPHAFVPSARQVASINEADLVVVNGFGLEEGLNDVLVAAADDGVTVVEAFSLHATIPFSDGSGEDPHLWMDPINVIDAIVLIGAHLEMLQPDAGWVEGAVPYADELRAADRQIEAMLAGIPAERRKLVTNHDSLGYFADRYGFEIIGTVIPGGTSLGDPSSSQLAELVEVIEAEQVPAIFAETTEPVALAEAVAAEAGHPVSVVELYTGSLGEPGTGADTLIGMLLVDAGRIAEALRP